MNVFKLKSELISFLNQKKFQDKNIGFVPTMGALHIGHKSLIDKACAENDLVVVSIFVNPTQFNNKQDLTHYPKPLHKDLKLLEQIDKHIVVFTPTVENIYGTKNPDAVSFDFSGLDAVMEGAFRANHFNGVAMVVLKLLEIVSPRKAYFGEKDFQQLVIIKYIVKKHKVPTIIVGCPVFRESSGLAYSSRNQRLSEKHKKEASFIYQILSYVHSQFGIKSVSEIKNEVVEAFAQNQFLKLEYFEIAFSRDLKTVKRTPNKSKCRAFVAAYTEDVRLIDNMALN